MSAGDEDCLVVDVFTPKLGYDTPLPVVVYVGGASVGHDHHRCAVEPFFYSPYIQNHILTLRKLVFQFLSN